MRHYIAAACVALSACAISVSDPEDPTGALEKCRTEARAAYYVGEASEDEAMDIYQRCLIREGV